MPNPFPSLRAPQMLRVLGRLGYLEQRRSGSHRRLVADGRPPLTFAFHDRATLPPGVVRDILMRQIGLTVDEALEVGRVADDTVHLIVRRLDDTCYATSPQAPGLAYGRSTMTDLRAGVGEALSFYFDRPGPFRVLEHEERLHEVGDRELVIRLARDEHREERQEVHQRLLRALAVPEQAEVLISRPANRVGEVLYLCAVPSDTLGWVVAQLDPNGETAILAVAVGDALLLTFRVSTGDGGPVEPRHTVADLMRTQPILQPVPASLAV